MNTLFEETFFTLIDDFEAYITILLYMQECVQ